MFYKKEGETHNLIEVFATATIKIYMSPQKLRQI